MLDTNIVSHVLRYPSGPAATRIRTFGKGDLCISVVVLAELYFGAAKIGSPALKQRIDMALQLCDVLPLGIDVAVHYAALRTLLERSGTPIGPQDTFIAAHALSLGLLLVTDNVREFSRVPDLPVDNWLD